MWLQDLVMSPGLYGAQTLNGYIVVQHYREVWLGGHFLFVASMRQIKSESNADAMRILLRKHLKTDVLSGIKRPKLEEFLSVVMSRDNTDKIEFFKSKVVWNALGWDHEETCFYWQHKTAKTVIRVHCDALDGAKRETLSHAITAKRGSAKPLVEYLLDREGSALAVDELLQSQRLGLWG